MFHFPITEYGAPYWAEQGHTPKLVGMQREPEIWMLQLSKAPIALGIMLEVGITAE